MKAEKGVFSWNLPRLGIDLLLRPPHPAGRFLSPGSRVWGCFGAFPRRRFHLCFGRFSTRFELESNRDRKAGIAGRIRPRRARPRRGPQPTITWQPLSRNFHPAGHAPGCRQAGRLRAGHSRRRATWRVRSARRASLGRGFERRGSLVPDRLRLGEARQGD